GQPELEERLKKRELRQLDQRIGIRCYLGPLSKKETFRYVEHRMRIAGLDGALPFARSALVKIHAHGGGVPRVINLCSDRALTAGLGARAGEITPAVVKAAIRNLEGERRRPDFSRVRLVLSRWMLGPTAAVVVGVLLVGLVTTVAYRRGWVTPPRLLSY